MSKEKKIAVLVSLVLPIFAVLQSSNLAYGDLISSPLPSPLNDESTDIPGEFIITLKNNSLPIYLPPNETLKNESAVSASANYLQDREQTILHKYDDGLAVKIPPNMTRSATSSIGNREANETGGTTTLIDVLSVYSPKANVSDIISTPVLNSSIPQEKDINVGISTTLSIPAQNATLLGTTKINDTTTKVVTTPTLKIVIPGKNTTLSSVIAFNSTNQYTTTKSLKNANASTSTTPITSRISIPAQNATLLGTTKINDTTVALISIPAQNATVISANKTIAKNSTLSIPAQNATVIAASRAEQPANNSTEICDIIRLNPAVKSCTPNLAVGLSSLSNAEAIVQQISTGLKRIEGNTTFLNFSKTNVTIAVVDSGVNPHPDINLVGAKSCLSSGKLEDDLNHGTHVAGIAAAKDNSIGVLGVAPGANIFSIKVVERNDITGKKSGGLAEVKCAFDFINKNTKWIDVVNLSIEMIPKSSHFDFNDVNDLVKEVIAKNVTVVGAAGNHLIDAARQWPGEDPNIIAVGAISDSDGRCGGMGSPVQIWSNDRKPPGIILENGKILQDKDDSFASSYSNIGDAIDIVAPGTDILSTSNNRSYHVDTGTSMASPYVAGAAAVYIASHPEATPFEVRNDLLNTAWKSADKTCYYGVDDPFREPEVPLLHIEPLEKNIINK